MVDNPKPVPIPGLVVKNGSKILFFVSSFIPIPVSEKVNRTSCSCLSVLMVIIPPAGIASMALNMRLTKMSLISDGMALTGGTDVRSVDMSMAIFLDSASSFHRGRVC